MTHAFGIIGLLAILAWLLPALLREFRRAHERGLDRVHAGRSWTARDTCMSLTGWDCPGRPGALRPHCACDCHTGEER